MTAISDTAALAAIGAAARELKLPTIRADAARLAEIAVRERQTHLGYLAEVLAAEIDDRTGRRRTRRSAEAKFPRIKRLADFSTDAIPGIAATLATLAAGAWIDAGQPLVLVGDSGTGKNPSADRTRAGRVRARPPCPLRHHRPAGQRTRRSRRQPAAVPRRGSLRPPGPAAARRTRLRPARPPAAPNCCSRSSPNARNGPPSASPPTCRSAKRTCSRQHVQVGRRSITGSEAAGSVLPGGEGAQVEDRTTGGRGPAGEGLPLPCAGQVYQRRQPSALPSRRVRH